ncbi:hypothetical protein [Deinococcus rubellus]|uniref:hypothetical protein n=1 Tax=Deinococcus rubellus TaxID=1889240 RepID=UPI0031F18D8B
MNTSVPCGAFSRHLQQFQPLFGDRRLFAGFSSTRHGILSFGGLHLWQIARCAPTTTCTKHAERWLRRLSHNQNARADLRPECLTQTLNDLGARQLAGADEVLVILDESDLCKPHSEKMESPTGGFTPSRPSALRPAAFGRCWIRPASVPWLRVSSARTANIVLQYLL